MNNIECKVCGEFILASQFNRHLKNIKNIMIHPQTAKEYYDLFYKKEGEGICQNPNCMNENPETKFMSLGVGYTRCCCSKCRYELPSTKEKQIATVQRKREEDPEWYQTIIDKRQSSCIKKFGVPSFAQTKEFMDAINSRDMIKRNKTYIENSIKKYEFSNPMKTEIKCLKSKTR